MDNKSTQQPHGMHEGDETLAFLRKLEQGFLRAIHGIGVFIWKKIPALARRFAAWLRETCAYAYLVGVRVARVVGLFLAWAAIVFGPLILCFGWITGVWTLLALVGSAWGVNRQIRKGQGAWTMWKEDAHA
jgi:hypothetical protein